MANTEASSPNTIEEAQENVRGAIKKGFVDAEEKRKRKPDAKKQRTQ